MCFHGAKSKKQTLARSKRWPSAKRWDKLTHYDISLALNNKLSSSCSLLQQTSARLYGAIEQATDEVYGLGRSQRTDTNKSESTTVNIVIIEERRVLWDT